MFIDGSDVCGFVKLRRLWKIEVQEKEEIGMWFAVGDIIVTNTAINWRIWWEDTVSLC